MHNDSTRDRRRFEPVAGAAIRFATKMATRLIFVELLRLLDLVQW